MIETDTYTKATAGSLTRALRAREVSALELFDMAVARIEAENPRINAVVVRDFDRARDAAKAADAALTRGDRRPLLGIPMTVKESHHVAGLPTTWGLEPFAHWIPKRDATGITRLKEAGAVILGKTNVPPSLGDWQSDNPIYGRTNNPHDPTRSPGGSSGGSAAAVASGMVPIEFGSDIGGSIRVPSHFCGVYGHKPTYNLIPLTGHSPPPIDDGAGVEFAVVGPHARTASDLDLLLGILAGPDGDDAKGRRVELPRPRAERLGDFRVLVIEAHPSCATDRIVTDAIDGAADAATKAGAAVTRGSQLVPDLASAHMTYIRMLLTIISRGEPGAVSPMEAHAWFEGLDTIAAHRRQWAALFDAFDVVLAPTFGTVAFPHIAEPDWGKRTLTINGAPTGYGDQLAWPGTATFPGLPATCAPIATSADGLPIGMQIIGPWLEDRTTIAFAQALARERG
ncbi:MAG TPA: amidase family protein [Candidatus Binatia bacterium]|jgi:amidase